MSVMRTGCLLQLEMQGSGLVLEISNIRPINHKLNCRTKPADTRSRSCNDSEDSVSSLTSIKRRPEEFEIIQLGTRTELGKGSYGCVKLVKDRQNGKLFAMKIVRSISKNR